MKDNIINKMLEHGEVTITKADGLFLVYYGQYVTEWKPGFLLNEQSQETQEDIAALLDDN